MDLCLALHAAVSKDTLYASFIHVMGDSCGLSAEQDHKRYIYLNRGELNTLVAQRFSTPVSNDSF